MKYPDRILLVEDQMIIAMHLKNELAHRGVKHIEIAANAAEAIGMIEIFQPELLCLDIELGEGMNGIELAHYCNENYQLPFIYVSGNVNEKFIERVADTNPYGFITKPIDFNNLASCIHLAMRKYEIEQELLEEKKRGTELKLLSESNPNLIMRLGIDGFIHYANPLIQRISGKNSDEYIGRPMTETDLHEDLQTIYITLIEKVKKRKIRSYVEETINTVFGERFFEVHAIPEKDQTGNVISVIIIKNDITDQKIVLTEVQRKNRYISDSINYGKKIQSAIIPDESILERYFSDFFMINSPKDVVSGDFPWFYKKDQYVYLAAVDCTGHGVPGAFMSLVTNFLLNTVMSRSEAIDPASVLDRLHLLLKRTLKQHYKGALNAVTPTSKHVLDADTRFSRLIDMSLDVIMMSVEIMLAKFSQVKVIVCEGNHDLVGSMWIRKAIKKIYEKNKRVEVDDTDFPFYAHLHGKIMLAFHHGHKVKNGSLPALFSSEPRYRKMWGEAEYTYIHTGHYHHTEQMMGEGGGAIVERHPTLSGKDAYAARGGYHSWRAAHAITYHSDYGEHRRVTVTPKFKD